MIFRMISIIFSKTSVFRDVIYHIINQCKTRALKAIQRTGLEPVGGRGAGQSSSGGCRAPHKLMGYKPQNYAN